MGIFSVLGLRTGLGSPTVARIAALALAVLGVAGFASVAAADAITGGSVDQGRACTTVNCALGSETFQLAAPADVAGTITLDTGAMTLDFVFTAASFALDETTAGTEDNGVASILFTSVTYSGSVGVFEVAPGAWIVNPASTASVAGGQVQYDDTAAPVNPGSPDFDAALARLTGNCLVAGSSLTCGLTFGTTGFAFEIGSASPAARYFQQTADVVATSLPEPSTLAMLGLGVGLTGFAGRRR